MFAIQKSRSFVARGAPLVRSLSLAVEALDGTLIADRTPMIQPSFWTGKPAVEPAEYEIDCSKFDMKRTPQQNPELLARMEETFNRVGLVHLRNTGLEQFPDMSLYAKALTQDATPYKAGANSRSALGENVFETGAPRQAHLHYHHEMAYVNTSYEAVGFCCSAAPEGKGAMFVSENIGATEWILQTELGQKLKEKGVCYIRNLTNRDAYPEGHEESAHGVYNHWQRSFGVDDAATAEAMAVQRGLQVSWSETGMMKTKCYISAFEYFAPLRRNLLFSSVADDSIWFDTWPGVAELPTMGSFQSSSEAERPLKLLFGDDSEFTRQELATFVEAYDRFGLPLNWRRGDVAVMCNYRFAHGRPSYSLEEGEERTLGVVLGRIFNRQGQRDDARWL